MRLSCIRLTPMSTSLPGYLMVVTGLTHLCNMYQIVLGETLRLNHTPYLDSSTSLHVTVRSHLHKMTHILCLETAAGRACTMASHAAGCKVKIPLTRISSS